MKTKLVRAGLALLAGIALGLLFGATVTTEVMVAGGYLCGVLAMLLYEEGER